jgi:hypothetical protein
MRRSSFFGVVLVVALFFVGCGGPGALPDRFDFAGVEAEMFRGPQHCGWNGTHFVLIDEDLPGADVTNVDMPGSHMFVRDPDQVREYSFGVEEDLDRALPEDAEELGDSGDASIGLWYSESDPHYVFLIGDDISEAWARATNWGLCA